jgi:hypothetical protein
VKVDLAEKRGGGLRTGGRVGAAGQGEGAGFTARAARTSIAAEPQLSGP